jgi:peptidoglycan/LPS O-acetylase OafA/YrhL
MGYYRLILAILVALSHMGVRVFGRNPGAVAVISFFLLSGFVMTGLVRRYYLKPRLVPLFYLDRLARLYPQFFVYVTAGLVVAFLYQPDRHVLSDITPVQIALNYLMVPLDFYMFGAVHYMVIMPAWTLGLEVCFYLVIPFILIYEWRKPLFYLSGFIFALAFAKIIPTDAFTYFLLPGTLFIFLCGSLMFDHRREANMPQIVRRTCWAALAFLTIALAVQAVRIANNREVPIGILLGIPMVWCLRLWKSNLWDEFAGNLSYGLFLNHYILIGAARTIFGVKTFHFSEIMTVLAVALVLAALTFYGVERPFLIWRHRQRQKLAPRQPSD